MSKLSPAAQAVLDATEQDGIPLLRPLIAAALRAAAELDTVKPQAVGPRDDSYGSSTDLVTISEQELKYRIALAVKQSKVDTYRALCAIASELEGVENA